MATWTTRPPQYRFDGSDAKRAIAAYQEAQAEADHNGAYWAGRVEYYSDKCRRKMGADTFARFIAGYTLDGYTKRQVAFALMRLLNEMKFSQNEQDWRRAFGQQ